MWVLALKSERVSANVLAKVLESEHLGAGGLSEVSAKFQNVGTWALEVPECEYMWTGSLGV